MRRIRALAGLALVVLMTGCVRSVNPIYTEGDLTFDPGLLGAWLEKEVRVRCGSASRGPGA